MYDAGMIVIVQKDGSPLPRQYRSQLHSLFDFRHPSCQSLQIRPFQETAINDSWFVEDVRPSRKAPDGETVLLPHFSASVSLPDWTFKISPVAVVAPPAVVNQIIVAPPGANLSAASVSSQSTTNSVTQISSVSGGQTTSSQASGSNEELVSRLQELELQASLLRASNKELRVRNQLLAQKKPSVRVATGRQGVHYPAMVDEGDLDILFRAADNGRSTDNQFQIMEDGSDSSGSELVSLHSEQDDDGEGSAVGSSTSTSVGGTTVESGGHSIAKKAKVSVPQRQSSSSSNV